MANPAIKLCNKAENKYIPDCRSLGRKNRICLTFSLTGKSLFVFYECTTAAGILLNDKKFGTSWLQREHIDMIPLDHSDQLIRVKDIAF